MCLTHVIPCLFQCYTLDNFPLPGESGLRPEKVRWKMSKELCLECWVKLGQTILFNTVAISPVLSICVPKGWIDVDEMLQLLYLTRPDFPLNSKNLGPKHHQRRKQEAWPLKVQGELIPKASWIFWEGLPLRSKKGHRIKNCRSDSMVFYVECSSFCILTQNNINSCQHLLFLTHIPCQTKLSWYILVYSVIGILQNYRILMKYPVFLPGLNTQIWSKPIWWHLVVPQPAAACTSRAAAAPAVWRQNAASPPQDVKKGAYVLQNSGPTWGAFH